MIDRVSTVPTPPPRAAAAAPTLAQVAEKAGVSLKTASRVINAEPRVAEDTRQRVLDAAAQLGYQPNHAASQLARGVTSRVVGLITGDLSNPFYSALAKGVEQELRSRDMQLTIASSDEESDRERVLVSEFVNRHVTALILVSTLDEHSTLAGVQARNVPIVFADRIGIGLDADSVVVDNEGGAHIGTAHLIAHGHWAVGFIGDLARLETHRERFEGYRRAMVDAELDQWRWVRHGAHDVESARLAAISLLQQEEPPTALFTSNNRITIGALKAIDELGLDTALVGFDDFELADVSGVSVIAHDPVEMGAVAARLAIAAAERTRFGANTVVLPTWLIARGSGERSVPRPRGR